jgi:hypothetical protein
MAVELQGRRCSWIAVALTLLATPALAQSDTPGVSAGYEMAFDRFNYFFENPSTFDSPDLIPHNFKQTYWGDNQWAFVAVRYRVAGEAMETTFAMTPSRETRGDDVDMFFLRSGDAATSGTSGRVDMRSMRIRQDVAIATRGGFTWYAGYQYRRDRQEFHARQIKTVTHTQPASSESFPIDGAERTLSETHEVFAGLSHTWYSSHWRIRARVNASPVMQARLTTILPFKYPGREIVFAAPVLAINPMLTLDRGDRWPVSVVIAATRTLSYTDARRFHRHAVTASVSVGRALR